MTLFPLSFAIFVLLPWLTYRAIHTVVEKEKDADGWQDVVRHDGVTGRQVHRTLSKSPASHQKVAASLVAVDKI